MNHWTILKNICNEIYLDTHSFLWFIADDKKISPLAKQLIEIIENVRLLSISSLWEISIKQSLGKLELPDDYQKFMSDQLKKNQIEILPINLSHLAKVKNLEFHHKDPFDRLIIAQSLIENIPVISIDERFDDYGVDRLW